MLVERQLGCRVFEKRTWRTIEDVGQDGLVLNSRSYYSTYHCWRCCYQVRCNDAMVSNAWFFRLRESGIVASIVKDFRTVLCY